jgi:hypothetical protein
MDNKEKIFWMQQRENRELAEMLNSSIDRLERLFKEAEEAIINCRAFEMEIYLKKKLGQLNEEEFQKEQRRKQYQNQKKEKYEKTTKAGIRLP